MTIIPLLREGAFSPEDIARMTTAYDAAIRLLPVTERSDPIKERIASKIIEVTRQGERDPPRICARALQELGIALSG